MIWPSGVCGCVCGGVLCVLGVWVCGWGVGWGGVCVCRLCGRVCVVYGVCVCVCVGESG